jgi:hypothetical protein
LAYRAGKGFIVTLVSCGLLLLNLSVSTRLYHERPVQFSIYMRHATLALELKDSPLFNIFAHMKTSSGDHLP